MIAILDYGLGNVASVVGAVERLEYEVVVTSDPVVLSDADKLILPGVGAFGDGMRNLHERGLVKVLEDLVQGCGKPILGICLGAQLFAHHSEEFGFNKGLGWLDAVVRPLKPDDSELRVPHVGWDVLYPRQSSVLLEGVPKDALFYYVHSYCIEAGNADIIVGICEYGHQFAALLQFRNIYATQFHPEKSQLHGLTVMHNFLKWG